MAAISQEKSSGSSDSSIVESYASRLRSPSEGKFLQVDFNFCAFHQYHGYSY